jgi:hypothetical protein
MEWICCIFCHHISALFISPVLWKTEDLFFYCRGNKCLVIILLSARFLSANVLKNYWRDQYETFQDDSLAFVDVRNGGHFFLKMHARAFEFLYIKTCKTNIFILCSNSFKFILRSPIDLHVKIAGLNVHAPARVQMLFFG